VLNLALVRQLYARAILCVMFGWLLLVLCVPLYSAVLMLTKMTMVLNRPASTMAALLLGQTDSTLRTLDVVHSSFSYVVVRMILTSSTGPPLAIIINYTHQTITCYNHQSDTITTKSTGTVHTSAKGCLTAAAIWIRIPDPDCHQNLIICSLAH